MDETIEFVINGYNLNNIKTLNGYKLCQMIVIHNSQNDQALLKDLNGLIYQSGIQWKGRYFVKEEHAIAREEGNIYEMLLGDLYVKTEEIVNLKPKVRYHSLSGGELPAEFEFALIEFYNGFNVTYWSAYRAEEKNKIYYYQPETDTIVKDLN